MQLSEFVETAQQTSTSRGRFLRLLVGGLVFLIIVCAIKFQGVDFSGKGPAMTDFDAFHFAGQLVWLGRIDEAYSFGAFIDVETELLGMLAFMPWTYPPPFNLVVAPLGLLPKGLAYFIFTGAGLAAYLRIAFQLDRTTFVTMVLLIFPALAMVIICGQNGLLTGSLIGLACLGLLDGRKSAARWAGVSLGLMIIKPHLAIGFGVYLLVARRWDVLLVAALTALAACGLATLLLGPDIWTAFVFAVGEAGGFLSARLYPLYRMVSVYSTLHTLQLGPEIAMAGQIVVAVLALTITVLATLRLPARQALGITAMGALLYSPYGYDYDLPIVGIGLMLLLSDLHSRTTATMRSWLYGLILFAGVYSMVRVFQIAPPFSSDTSFYYNDDPPYALASLGVIGALALMWYIFGRARPS
jgi:hypothetical protein